MNYDKDVEVTILDLPQQIQMMEENVKGKDGCERIKGFGIDLLDKIVIFHNVKGGSMQYGCRSSWIAFRWMRL